MDLTGDKGNFCKLTEVILSIIPKYLRQYFKEEWDKANPQMIWNDSPADGQRLTSKIKIRYPFNNMKNALAHGNRNDWDPTVLFFVLCSSGVIISHCRNPPSRVVPLRESEKLDKLRPIRNEFFAHRPMASIPLIEFNKAITEIENVFQIFQWQSGLHEIDAVKKSLIKTPLSQHIQQQLDAAIQLNDNYHTYYMNLEKDVRVIVKRQEDIEERSKGTEQIVKVIGKKQADFEEKIKENEQKSAVIVKRQEDIEERSKGTEQIVKDVRKRVAILEEEPKSAHGACGPSLHPAKKFKGACEPSIVTEPEVTGACGPSIVLAPELEDATQRLKKHYKDAYSKHAITVVSEDGKRIDHEEKDIRDFAVEVAIAGSKGGIKDANNDRIEFINRINNNRSRSKALLSELLCDNGITFIKGVAGIGKTVLSKQIAFQWANNEIYTEFDYLFFIESRDLSDSELDLDDFLEERSFHEDMDAKDIFFIIDGLDEIEDLRNQLRDKKSKLSQVLGISSHRFRKSRFILTGRPQMEKVLTEEFRKICNIQVFEVCGLSEEAIDKYITMFAKEDPIKTEQIKKTRDSSQNVEFSLKVPQYLNTLCCMSLMTGGMEIENFTELYTWLLCIIFKGHLKGSTNEDMSAEEILGKFGKLVTKLAKVAFKLFEKMKITFTQEEFESIFNEIEKDEAMVKEFRVFYPHRDGGIQLQQMFWFLHLKMPEYLASLFCFVNRIAPGDFIKNSNFEVLNFLSGLHGCTLKKLENEESIVNIFVRECLRSEEKQEEESCLFMLNLLDELKDSRADVKNILLQRGLTCLSEYLSSRFKYVDENHLKKIMSRLIDIDGKNWTGLNVFACCSSISQRNLHSLMEIADKTNLFETFRNVQLSLYSLSYFPLCKYFRYFGLVDLRVCNNQSAAELKLLFDVCLSCNQVQLYTCKISEGCFDSHGCSEGLNGDVDTPRIESFLMTDCTIDEIVWKNIIRLIPMVKKVTLMSIKAKKMRRWKELVDIIEQEKRGSRSRLTEITFRCCEIDGYLVERIKEAGVKIA